MGRDMRPSLVAIAFVALVVGVWFVAEHGAVSKDARSAPQWIGVLFDYQAIVGGLLAIAAAWITVLEMRRNERAAANRFKRQVVLQTRPDAYRFERLYSPQRYILNACIARLQEQRPRHLNPADMTSDRNFMDFETGVRARATIAKNILEDVFAKQQWQEGENLLNGRCTSLVDSIEKTARMLAGATKKIDAELKALQNVHQQAIGQKAVDRLEIPIRDMDQACKHLSINLNELIPLLDQHRDVYIQENEELRHGGHFS